MTDKERMKSKAIEVLRRTCLLEKKFNQETPFESYIKMIKIPLLWTLSSSGESYFALGLAGEVGEVVELIKKSSSTFHDTPAKFHERLKEEIGDVLGYLTSLSNCLGIDMREVMGKNFKRCSKKTFRRVVKLFK